MITLKDFQEKFITIDFDNYLKEQDNNLVNSNEFYLQYKNEYITTSKNNYEIFKELLSIFNQLYNNYSKSSNKYVYNYIDNNECSSVNNKIKKLIISQTNYFNNFINHINFLNNQYIVNSNSNIISNSRMTKLSNK